jgi:hypothetical protein
MAVTAQEPDLVLFDGNRSRLLVWKADRFSTHPPKASSRL